MRAFHFSLFFLWKEFAKYILRIHLFLPSMRLIAVPVLKNHWAYHCHTSIPSKSHLTRAVTWAGSKWDGLGTRKGRAVIKIYNFGNQLLDRMEYEEWFLKSIPMKEDAKNTTLQIPVVHPSTIPSSEIQSHLTVLLDHRVKYHRQYITYSAWCIPLSSTFVVVPVIPNFPLFYNLFRLYSHYKAYKGTQHLIEFTSSNALSYRSSPTLDSYLHSLHLKTPSELDLPKVGPSSSKFLSRIIPPAIPAEFHNEFDGAVTNKVLKNIGEAMEMPELEKEVKRARTQILWRIASERMSNSFEEDPKGHI